MSWTCPHPAGCVQRRPHRHYLPGPGRIEELIYEDDPPNTAGERTASITVYTERGPRTWRGADDFTVDFESGTLTVKKTNDQGTTLAIFAVYAPGAWQHVVNDAAEAEHSA